MHAFLQRTLSFFEPLFSNGIHDVIDIGDDVAIPRFPQPMLLQLCDFAEALYQQDSNVIRINSPVVIVGDIHGNLHDLIRIIATMGRPPQTRYLFLGDYVDRGHQSIHTFLYLAFLKILDPKSIYLIRGNHEARAQNMTYGFHSEIMKVYGNEGLWRLFNETFDLLPCCAIVDKSIFGVHGGLSKDANLVQRISQIDRFGELPDKGLYTDLCWSDPDENKHEYVENTRGAGWLFGAEQTDQFLHVNKLSLVARAHQLAQDGYKWYFDNKLVLVWSAPNYCYKAGNMAAIMCVNGDNEPEFEVFDQDPRSGDAPPDAVVPEYFM